MKHYIKTIFICSLVLLFFPFIALPEFWEYFFVVIPAFVIAYLSLKIFRSPEVFFPGESNDSLQDYIERLQKRFREEKKKPHTDDIRKSHYRSHSHEE